MTHRFVNLSASFRGLDGQSRDALADIESPLHLGLAALVLAEDKTKLEWLNLDQMVDGLVNAGISIRRLQLGRALARGGDRVNRKKMDGEVYYKVTIRGRREINPLLNQGTLTLSYLEGDRPRTARKQLADILSHLSGLIRICDPYYGVRTLDTLEMISATCDVRFLTARTTEKSSRLSGPIHDFKRERPRTELRIYPKASELHDRYILSADKLLIAGHGFKDLGCKESFIIAIQQSLVPNMLSQVREAFDAKWLQATSL